MGCPFPMQYHAGRGSGLLPHPDRVVEIITEMALRSEVTFSVKMRLGLNDSHEAAALLPLLNGSPITLVTLHPRLGVQGYKGKADLETFEAFYNGCSKPMAYNGDIRTVEDIDRIIYNRQNEMYAN